MQRKQCNREIASQTFKHPAWYRCAQRRINGRDPEHGCMNGFESHEQFRLMTDISSAKQTQTKQYNWIQHKTHSVSEYLFWPHPERKCFTAGQRSGQASRCLERNGRLNIYWTENESINNLAAITRVATPSKSNSVTAGFEQLPVASDHPSLSTTVMLHMHLHAWTIFTNESAVTLAGAGKQFMQKKQNSKNLLRYYARHLHTSLLWSWMHAIAWKSFWQERSFLATKMPALEAYCSDMCSDNVAVKLGDQRLRTTSGRDWLPSLSTTVLFHTHLHAWTTLAYEVALRLVDAGNQFWIKKNATLLWYYAHVGAWKQG